MTYDCFLYNGEARMLELRMDVLREVVDVFVPVIGTRTFRGNQKPPTIIPKGPKIQPVIVPIPAFKDPWMAESFTRECSYMALEAIDADDHVLVGDVDEIPDPENVGKCGTHLMRMYYYNWKWEKMKGWLGTVGVRGLGIMAGLSPAELRYGRDKYPIIQGGWHLSYFFQTPEEISQKIKSFSHYEYDLPEFTDPEIIRARIARGEDLFGRLDEDEVMLPARQPILPRVTCESILRCAD